MIFCVAYKERDVELNEQIYSQNLLYCSLKTTQIHERQHMNFQQMNRFEVVNFAQRLQELLFTQFRE